jgi:hypothetical protein
MMSQSDLSKMQYDGSAPTIATRQLPRSGFVQCALSRALDKVHARRKLFELADIASKARKGKPSTISPIAFEAVQKFDAIFALERAINGSSPEQRVAARRKDIAPLVNGLIDWMKRERSKLSRHNDVAKAFDMTTCSSASMRSRASSMTVASV